MTIPTLLTLAVLTQTPAPLRPFVKEDAPILVLDHVRIIDGTGAPALEDMRLELTNGKISKLEKSSSAPAKGKVLDLTGKTVLPGLVGLHEHLFYTVPGDVPAGVLSWAEQPDSAPRLYLAGGVTTARTAGSIEPYTDLSLKQLIDSGQVPGPKLHVTGPYLGALLEPAPQMHTVNGPADAARTVDYWAAEGVTSFKAYMNLKPEELKVVIDHAHAKGLKVTGHLCSVGFREAAALGIDNLEHGLAVDTEFYPGKKPGLCPDPEAEDDLADRVEVDSAPVQAMIRDLVAHHVAITSTLAMWEITVPNRPPLARQQQVRPLLTDSAWTFYLHIRALIAEKNRPHAAAILRKEMQFERAFVKAGGLLLAGCDPTSFGGVLPGFGDQRELELLVEAGFTPLEAIHIGTQNGAKYLGQERTVGSISVGLAADLLVVDGNPAAHIEDVEKVELVFKDGLGFDPAKLVDSVRGMVGQR